MKSWWKSADKATRVRLFKGDVIDVLRKLPEKSVHLTITSSPYWNLRNYEVEGQIGNEATPDLFVRKMVEVFRECRRVLRDDGILILNLGDTYCSSPDGNKNGHPDYLPCRNEPGYRAGGRFDKTKFGLRSGNLIGIPWRVALALQADGWVLRSDIPWVKRSPMPESNKNRPAKSLEYVFMFVKRMGYFYDHEAVKRASIDVGVIPGGGKYANNGMATRRTLNESPVDSTRNFWQADLWFDSVDKPHGLTGIGDEIVGIDVTTRGLSVKHFASFPQKLVEPFIKTSTSRRGACPKCGAPWPRILERTSLKRERPNDYVKRTGEEGTGNSCANTVAGVSNNTLGWKPSCSCYGLEIIGKQPRKPSRKKAKKLGVSYKELRNRWKQDLSQWYADVERLNPFYQACETVACVVADIFVGTGTVPLVAQSLGRRSIGIDLSEEYLKMAKKRIESRGIIGRKRKPEPDDLFVFDD